jgi:hypothetical protein
MITINRNPSRKQLWWFAGLWLPLFGAAMGSSLYWRMHAPRVAIAVWAVTAVAAVASLLSEAAATAVFLTLSYATFPIGFVVSWVALAALYFLVLTPLGLVMRLAGRDSLRLKVDERDARASTGSYWTERPGRGTDSARAFRQF